jgi:hypothetical protein
MNGTESYYLDTSALLPYYREEAVSPVLEDFLRKILKKVIRRGIPFVARLILNELEPSG